MLRLRMIAISIEFFWKTPGRTRSGTARPPARFAESLKKNQRSAELHPSDDRIGSGFEQPHLKILRMPVRFLRALDGAVG
jgi:hypothetical protein